MRMHSAAYQAVLIFIVLSLGACGYNSPKVAFVRSGEVIQKYAGLSELKAEYASKETMLKQRLDSLHQVLNSKELNSNQADNRLAASGLESEKANLIQYQQMIEKDLISDQNNIEAAISNQINSFIKKYAEEQGYDIILGTTASGSILYGNKQYDITEAVIKELNEQYKNEQ
jgi:outer membrane protein